MLARVDPEVAAATFAKHVMDLWATSQPVLFGWDLWFLDDLHVVVQMRATRSDGTHDRYFVRLGAEYYDAAPPVVTFVTDDGITPARGGTKFWPRIEGVPWFGLHDVYNFPGGRRGQLVCFSASAEFYLDHSPTADARWKRGVHTVAATLHRLAEVLRAPNYKGPAGC